MPDLRIKPACLVMARQIAQVFDLARRQTAAARTCVPVANTRALSICSSDDSSRDHTESAALTEICCPTIERASV